MHIILSGYCQDHQLVLSDLTQLQIFISQLVDVLGMEAKGDLKYEIFDSVNGEADMGGISACQFIYTSSITIHTYPEWNYIDLDIFSCQPIPDEAMEWLNKYLQLKPTVWMILPQRGAFDRVRDGYFPLEIRESRVVAQGLGGRGGIIQ